MTGAAARGSGYGRALSEIKMLRAEASRVSQAVAGRVHGEPGEYLAAERATHARFIERGYSFGISTRPDQGGVHWGVRR